MVVGILALFNVKLTPKHFTWLRADKKQYTKSRSHINSKVQFNGNK